MTSIAKLKDRARKHEQKENWAAAIQAYQKVLETEEGQDEVDLELGLFNRIGDLYLRLGQTDDAVSYYEQAADKYAEAGFFNNAIALCNKALRHRPNRAPLYLKLSSLCAEQGFFTDARRWILEYAERQLRAGNVDAAMSGLGEFADLSDDPDVRELLAQHLSTHDRPEEAVDQLRLAHAQRLAEGDEEAAGRVADQARTIDPDVELTDQALPTLPPTTADELPGLPEPDEADEADDAGEPAEPAELEVEPTRLGGDEEAEEDVGLEGLETHREPSVEHAGAAGLPGLEDSGADLSGEDGEAGVEGLEVSPAGQETAVPDEVETEELGGLETFDAGAGPSEEPEETDEVEHAAAGVVDEELETDTDEEEPEPLPLLDTGYEDEPEYVSGVGEEEEAEAGEYEGEEEPLEEEAYDEEAEEEDEGYDEEAEEEDEAAEEEAAEDEEPVEPLPFMAGAGEPAGEPAVAEAAPGTDIEEPSEYDAAGDDAIAAKGGEEDASEEPAEEAPFEEPAEEAPFEEPAEEAPFEEPVAGADEHVEPLAAEGAPMETEDPAGDVEVEPGEPGETGAEAEEDGEDIFDVSSIAAARPFDEGPHAAGGDMELGTLDLGLEGGTPLEEPVEDLDVEAVLNRARQQVSRGLSSEALRELRLLSGAPAARETFEDALAIVREIVRHDANNVEALQRRVEYAARLGEQERLVGAYIDLADALARLGAEAKARAMYERVLGLDPRNEVAREALGVTGEEEEAVDLKEVLLEGGEDDETAPTEREARPTDPAFAAMLSQLRAKVGENADGEEAGDHYDLGLAFKEMGLIDEAIAEFQTALTGGTERLKVYEELGQCFIMKGQYTVAIKVLNRALQVPYEEESELLGVYYHLGQCYEELGQRGEAREVYEKVLAIDESFADVPSRVARL